MSNYYKNVARLKRFDLRNTDLAFLAVETAIDLRNYIDKRRQEDKSILYLSKLLDEATQGEDPLATCPNNAFVLMYAIPGREKSNEYWKGRPIEDVGLETKLRANELKDFKNLPREKQEELINFCLRLSKEVVLYQQEYYFDRHRLVA